MRDLSHLQRELSESTSRAVGDAPTTWHGHPARVKSWPRWPCHKNWIPAGAGMTSDSDAILFQMTPVPQPVKACPDESMGVSSDRGIWSQGGRAGSPQRTPARSIQAAEKLFRAVILRRRSRRRISVFAWEFKYRDPSLRSG